MHFLYFTCSIRFFRRSLKHAKRNVIASFCHRQRLFKGIRARPWGNSSKFPTSVDHVSEKCHFINPILSIAYSSFVICFHSWNESDFDLSSFLEISNGKISKWLTLIACNTLKETHLVIPRSKYFSRWISKQSCLRERRRSAHVQSLLQNSYLWCHLWTHGIREPAVCSAERRQRGFWA